MSTQPATTGTARPGPTVSFAHTDEQAMLRQTVRELASTRAGSERVREVMLGDDGFDRLLWDELAAMGLAGLTVPEEHGGAGATFTELAIVVEELGRRLAPVPLLSSAVMGVEVVLRAGTPEQHAAHLPAVAAGTTRLAVAHLGASGRVSAPPDVQARRDGDGWVLDGTAGYVVDGGTADRVVTAALTGAGDLALFLVPGDAAGLTRTGIEVLDLTRPMATLAYDGVRVGDDARLSGGDTRQALDAAVTAGVVALACEQVGGTQQVLEMTTAYARERVQFGRAIGSFQAVKHRLADMLVALESARSAAEHAARVLARGDTEELAVAAPLAKALCSETYEQATMDAIQLHGGIAFTWEHDAHLYMKRAKATKLLLGSPSFHRDAMGRALGL